jgi:hypothetical protein
MMLPISSSLGTRDGWRASILNPQAHRRRHSRKGSTLAPKERETPLPCKRDSAGPSKKIGGAWGGRATIRTRRRLMSQPGHFEMLILGSGQGAKLLAWDTARSGRRTAVVERRWVGGSCPNVVCMPSKNEIWSARVAYLAHHAGQFCTVSGPVATDMARVGSASATWSAAKSPFIWRTTSRPASN